MRRAIVVAVGMPYSETVSADTEPVAAQAIRSQEAKPIIEEVLAHEDFGREETYTSYYFDFDWDWDWDWDPDLDADPDFDFWTSMLSGASSLFEVLLWAAIFRENATFAVTLPATTEVERPGYAASPGQHPDDPRRHPIACGCPRRSPPRCPRASPRPR